MFEAETFLDRVSSFIDLCNTGFYEGVHICHAIPGFMAQFDCPHAEDPMAWMAGAFRLL